MESFLGNTTLYVYCRDFSCGHSQGSRVNISRTAIAAARLLLILAERQCSNAEETSIIDRRYQYLRNAVLQAKSSGIATDSSRNTIDSSIAVYLLECKLAVLRFQMQIKQELEYMASWLENTPGSTELLNDSFSRDDLLADAEIDMAAKDKARELSRNLKSITQLYNHYAVPFNLWEVCLEMLYFANYLGDANIKIVRKIWARLFDPAPTRGGDAEAWSVVKRVGSKLDPAVGECLPRDIICFYLEKAASDRLNPEEELIGDEDVAGTLLGACKSLLEPVLAVLRTRASPRRDKFVSHPGFLMKILEDKYYLEGKELSDSANI